MNGFLHDISWIIPYRNEALTPIFEGISWLGYPTFLMMLIPVCYWLWNKQATTRLVIIAILSILLNGFLKDFWQNPRPDMALRLDPGVAESFGMPSGHAQIAAILWFWLAYEIRKPWAWVGATVIVASICLSRIYLGVHDMEDILAGLAIAGISLLLFRALLQPRFERLQSFPLPIYLAMLIALQVVLAQIWPQPANSGAVIVLGSFLIAWLAGAHIEERYVGFVARSNIWAAPIIAVLGIVTMFAILALTNQLLSGASEQLSSYVSVVVMAAYMALGAPSLFRLLRLNLRPDKFEEAASD